MGAAANLDINLGIEMIRAINTGTESRRKGAALMVPDEVSHSDACHLVNVGAARWLISEEFAMLASTALNAAKRTRAPRGLSRQRG